MSNISRQMKEAYLVVSLFKKPELLQQYDEEKIRLEHFENAEWKFFYAIARKLYNKGITNLDEVSALQFVSEKSGLKNKYDEYGGWQTIDDVMEIIDNDARNFEPYLLEIKKSFGLGELEKLYGEKIHQEDGNYKPDEMTLEEITTYWIDKTNQISIRDSSASGFEESDLIGGLREYIMDIMEKPEIGLPVRYLNRLNRQIGGWLQGKMYITGSFSNGGKTSMMFKTYIMSCLEQNEKMVVIANEEGEKAFKEKLFVNIMGENGIAIDRFKFKSGDFSNEDLDKIYQAIDIIEKLVGNKDNTGLIKFVFLESFTEESVEKVMRHYAVRGYNYFLIDTLKVPDGAGEHARWAKLSDFTKRIYKLTRPEAGGLNVCTVLTIQLKLANVRQRFLTMDAIAEGKQIVNEADAFICWRDAYPDEYEGETNEVTYISSVKQPEHPDAKNGYVEKHMKLDKNKHYMFMFIPKNRQGANTSNSREVLVLEVNWLFGSVREVGVTKTIMYD